MTVSIDGADDQGLDSGRKWLPVPTLAEAVADWVAEEILNLRLQPGRRLTEGEVAAALGVSRQPVREAMRVLSEQGLLNLIPRVGAVVADFDPRTIVEIYEVRGVLESWIVSEVIKKADRQEIVRLEADFKALVDKFDPDFDPEFYDQAWEIRTSLYMLSDNVFAVQLSSDLRARMRNYPRVLRVDPDHVKVYQAYMSDLFRFCRSGDSARARELVVSYLNRNGERLSGTLKKTLNAP